MNFLIILFGVAAATMFWPLSRWVAHHEGRTEAYCFWMLLMSCIVSGILTVIFQQPLFVGGVWGVGLVLGLSYVICLRLVMFLLRWSSSGVTVTVNNMGLIWPVVAGVIYFNPRIPSAAMVAGIVAVCVALILLGFSDSTGNSASKHNGPSKTTISLLPAMLLLWVMAGVSMTAQAFAGNRFPQSYLAIIFVTNLIACLVFAPSFMRIENHFRCVEFVPGIMTALVQIATYLCVMLGTKRVGPELVFPLIIASPIIIMLLVGHFVLRERLSKMAWSACALGIAGLVTLSLS